MAKVDLKLSNGYTMPAVGLGTWTVFDNPPGVMTTAVKAALKAGYRLIDTATVYGTEPLIGEALKECFDEKIIEREDLFITTKLWNTDHRPERVEPALRKSLEDMGLEYIDLYLLHWPLAFKPGSDLFPKDADGNVIADDCPLEDTWKAIEACVKQGLARSIGLSNCSVEQTKRILAVAEVKPVSMQVELNPYCMNEEVATFCIKNGMTITCYAPIGAPGRTWKNDGEPILMDNPLIISLSKKYSKSPAQVILRFLLQKGYASVPKSVTPARIEENINISDFELTDQEVADIQGLNRNFRVYLEPMAKDHPEYPFKGLV